MKIARAARSAASVVRSAPLAMADGIAASGGDRAPGRLGRWCARRPLASGLFLGLVVALASVALASVGLGLPGLPATIGWLVAAWAVYGALVALGALRERRRQRRLVEQGKLDRWG